MAETTARREVVVTGRRARGAPPWRRRRVLWCYVFLLPQIVIFLAFVAWPTFASWYFAFFDWDGIGPPSDFVGLQNFREVATSERFWHSMRNTFLYTAALVLIVVPTSLVMALILNAKKLRGRTAYRVVFVLPVVLTSAVVGLEMQTIFATEGGVVNNLLRWLRVISHNVPWLNISSTAMVVVILVGSWKSFGTKMIYWLAGIQTISRDVYEAAEVDGAGAGQRLLFITVPILLPFLGVITYLQVLDGLHVFDLVKTMTGGGPYYATDMTSLYIYRYAFEPSSLGNTFALPRFGFASAAGIFYGLATFVVSSVFAAVIGYSRNRQKRVARDER